VTIIIKFKEVRDLKKHIKSLNKMFEGELKNGLSEELEAIDKDIIENKYKGIIIYPEAVRWEPVQRPQHLLKKFAENNYLCFFIEHNPNENKILKEVFPNLFIVNRAEKLLPLLKKHKVIFYITYFLQYEYAKQFENKTIWLDIVDRLDFFALYNSYSKKIWKKIISKADILSYSAAELKKYIKSREDAILLPNAVNPEDFIVEIDKVPSKLNKIDHTRPTIGYFGVIEEWFDWSIIKKIDDINLYNIVLIGPINSNINIDELNLKNTYMMGRIEYKELKKYAKVFNIAIIPFIVNDLTNSVSPIKFFEYLATNKPIITTNISEMKKYNSNIVKIIDETTDIENVIEELLKIDEKNIREEAMRLLQGNTWQNRYQIIEEKIEGALK